VMVIVLVAIILPQAAAFCASMSAGSSSASANC
jgi:hypothetical protein